MRIEQNVYNFLLSISIDTQMVKGHEDYCGFINVHSDSHSDPELNKGFVDLCQRPQYYASTMAMMNLTVESGFDVDETVFMWKEDIKLPTHTYMVMVTADEPCDTGIKFISATSMDEAFVLFLSWNCHLEGIDDDDEDNTMGVAEQLTRLLDEYPIGIALIDTDEITGDIDISGGETEIEWYHEYSNEHKQFPELFEEIE